MSKNDTSLTPMMKQFYQLKAKHPNAIMLFRCGDFYETYGDDAIEASKILGITLTRRNNGASQGAEMAGFPHHALDTYLPKLIRAGKRVAICDQLEDPKKKRAALKGKKGLTEMDKMVKRGITELVTPGIAMSDNVLNYKENNFLAAIHFGRTACGISFLDISTGEFLTGEGTYDYVEKLLGNFMPKEVLYDRDRKQDFERYFGTKWVTFQLDDWVFTEQSARQRLLKHFKTKSLKGFGVEHLKEGIIASGAIMQYLDLTQHTHISHITSLRRIDEERYVRLDRFTIRSLELVEPMQEDGQSLLNVIDRTSTPMGGRMLRRWIVFPLKDVKPICDRQNGVEYFFLTPEEFKQRIANDEFLEYEEVYKDRFYGTLKAQVEKQLAAGQNVIFDVDVVGGCNIKKFYGDRALSVFIQPPSLEELRKRLTGRGTDAPEVIESRLAKATFELSYAEKFDVVIVNDNLEKAQAEALKTIRDFIQQ